MNLLDIISYHIISYHIISRGQGGVWRAARPPEAAAGDAQAAAEARGDGAGAGPLRVEGRDQECDGGLHAGAGASDGLAVSAGWDLVFGPVHGSSASVWAEADTGGCGLRNILSVFVRGVLCGGV